MRPDKDVRLQRQVLLMCQPKPIRMADPFHTVNDA